MDATRDVWIRDGKAFPTGARRPRTTQLGDLHERSWLLPGLTFAASIGLWLALVAFGMWMDALLIRAATAVPLALACGQLFMIGHDAGHRSFVPSRTGNAIIGRLALLPSGHAFGLWRDHHNTHHRYTNLRGKDFVWAPLSPAEYRRLSSFHRLLHRFYRNRFGVGLGAHYAVEIWAPRMLWPRRVHGLQKRTSLVVDTVVFYLLVVGLIVASVHLAKLVNPDRVGDPSYWISVVISLFILPLIGTQWLIGFVIYFNHTHPAIEWFDDFESWSMRDAQLEGTAGLRFPGRLGWLKPRRIMSHTAHHVDPGIPLRHLPTAQQRLSRLFPAQIVGYDSSLRSLRDVLDTCKLYDFQNQRWLRYDETPPETT